MDHLLDKLNPAQREAATHIGSPLMIIAGAGTGKTRVITHRIAFLHLECGIPLNQIMAVTFTNKAAKEMRERVCHLLGLPDSPGLPIGTFHGRCALILRREAEAAELDKHFTILDENDQKQAIKRTLSDLDISEKRVKPGQVQSFINLAKMRLLTPQDCKEEFDEDEVPYPSIYEHYQKMLKKSKCIDFEDLLMKTVQLFETNEEVRLRWSNRYHYVLVDEYQDTNYAQFLITKLLAKDHRQVSVVGDEDQSIYSWRGAEISNLLDFEKTFEGTKIVKLEENYRSSGNILRAASTVIAKNKQRIGKVLYTNKGEGPELLFKVSQEPTTEGDFIAAECLRLIRNEGVDANEIAIFYRSHYLSRTIEDEFRRYRIPYRIVGGIRFYDRMEIKDLLCFLRLAINMDDDLAFERIVNKPARGVGAKTLSSIVNYSTQAGVSMLSGTQQLLKSNTIKGKGKSNLEKFLMAVYRWNDLAMDAAPHLVLKQILEDTNYKEDGVGDPNSIEGGSRIENIEEFENLMMEFKPTQETGQLGEFLTSMALDAAVNEEDQSPKVSLLTIHNAKGLEYDHVFMIGLESDVFPTKRALESFEETAIEEERRLFYVGITRARVNLYLMFSMRRNRFGTWNNSEPSMFLRELPPDVFGQQSLKQLKRILPYDWGDNSQGVGGVSKREDGELYVEYDEEQPEFGLSQQKPGKFARETRGLGTSAPRGFSSKPRELKYSEGMRVSHKYMGEGTIVRIAGRPGWEKAFIEFDDGRSQDFILRYAPLKSLEP